MPAPQSYPDICEVLFSLEEKLSIQPVWSVGARLADLLVRCENASRDKRLRPGGLAEWPILIDATYSFGFVCNNGGQDLGDREKTLLFEFFRTLESDLARADTIGLRDLCRTRHYIMRIERWGDCAARRGGGAVEG